MRYNRRAVLVIIFLFLSVSLAIGQSLEEEIQSLENDLKAIKFKAVVEKGRFLLADPYLTKKDSLRIYEYMLNAAYALGDTTQARKIAEEIVRCYPLFRPDPRITSPKIIEFYDQVAEKILKSMPAKKTLIPEKVSKIVEPVSVKTKYLLTSIIFPGSGHLLSGEKKKGYIFSAISAGFLGSIIYTAIKTNDARDAYMSAKGHSNFDQLYNTYNGYYKIRNYLLLGYGILSLYALYDLNTKGVKANKTMVSVQPGKNGWSLGLIKYW